MTTAFVLTGGGSLGAVQVGMLLALADRGLTPDLLVGTSVGALNAAFLAGDPSPRTVERLADVWRRTRRADVFPLPRPGAVFAVTARRDHVVSNGALRRLVCAHLPYARLEDAPWPVTVVATEATTGVEVALSRGPAAEAVLASSALPGVFPPVDVEGHVLIDGGVVNNAPISVALAQGADRVVVLPTGYACALPRPPRSAVGMLLHAFTLATQRRLIAEVAQLQGSVDLQVVPPLCPLSVSPIDFSRSGELIARARGGTRRWLDAPRADDQTRDLRLHHHRVPAPRAHSDVEVSA